MHWFRLLKTDIKTVVTHSFCRVVKIFLVWEIINFKSTLKTYDIGVCLYCLSVNNLVSDYKRVKCYLKWGTL